MKKWKLPTYANIICECSLIARISKSLTGIGWKPPMEDMNTMDPAPCVSICGTTDFAKRNDDFTFTSKILSHASSEH